MEETVRAPLRELRVEWDAAWTELGRVVVPVFRSWTRQAQPADPPSADGIASALHRVGRAIARRDEITARIETETAGNPPQSFAGRLAWVQEYRGSFENDPPVIAAALVHLGVTAEPEHIADRVRMILGEPDDSPAFGWLPFVRDCLWPKDGRFPNPVDPIEDSEWPHPRRVIADDVRRLEYLLWPTGRTSEQDRLFRVPRAEATVVPAGPARPTPLDRVRVTNFVERVLAYVPEPYPSGTTTEQEAGMLRWQIAHGQKDLHQVASEWKKQFADLAVNLQATLKSRFPPARSDDDLTRVVRELIDRGVRVWDAEWLFAGVRTGSNVSMAKREEAARWSVHDGDWMCGTLRQVLYTTPERFARFQDAVRRVVGEMLDAEPGPQNSGRTTAASDTDTPNPQPRFVTAESHKVALPAVVKNWLTAQYLADPKPTRWRRSPDAEREPVVFVRYEAVAQFLLDHRLDVLSSLDRWDAAGWIGDVMVELTPSPDPADAPPAGIARLRLPLGTHRLVAIYRSLLDAPTEPGPSEDSRPTPVPTSGPQTTRRDPLNSSPHPPNVALGVPVPTPAGATWEDVSVSVGDLMLTVSVGDFRRTLTHSEAGFADRKANGKPDRVWGLLCAVAAAGGVIPADGKRGGVDKNVKQAVSELRSRLRSIVGLKGDPLPHNSRDREYRAAFRLRSDLPATFSLPDGEGWDTVAITERADGNIEVTVNGTGHADGFDDRAGAVVAAERLTVWNRKVSLTAFGLVADGVPTPEGEALLTVLRGRGKVAAKSTDAAFLKLGKILATAFQTPDPAFEYRGGTWVAKFTADSHP